MKLSRCPQCGGRPEGTCDTIPAVALLRYDEDSDSYEYFGETRVGWDGQVSQNDSRGRALLLCENCQCEYPNLAVTPILPEDVLPELQHLVRDAIEKGAIVAKVDFDATGGMFNSGHLYMEALLEDGQRVFNSGSGHIENDKFVWLLQMSGPVP